jgi:hypothetical protein
MKPGDKVYIRFNPHRKDAENIVGTVVEFQPGAGFMGCDLVDVRYTDPWTGQEETMPFGTANLGPGSREELLETAERFEKQAAMLRQTAEAR